MIPSYRIPPTTNHQLQHQQWAHEHRAWRADWHQFAFSDESRFNLLDLDGCIHVRCYAAERCLPECVIERYSGFTPRVMQDSACPHVAKTDPDFSSTQHVQLLSWPACSPDMSPIEHVWDLVGRCLTRDPREKSNPSKNEKCPAVLTEQEMHDQDSPFEKAVMTKRTNLDFTEKLWVILKDCSSTEELIEILTFVYNSFDDFIARPFQSLVDLATWQVDCHPRSNKVPTRKIASA
ncbi:transposable element Tcb2 transposase [Trichonephila clavipes]|nr:transposable element Tcb2 transposase [Trichonephila clavipes]